MHVGNRTSSTLRVTASLLTQILSEPAFNVLRTKEQLGYIVLCSTWVLAGSGCAGIRIVIQSEKGPAYLEARVDAQRGDDVCDVIAHRRRAQPQLGRDLVG